MLKPTTPRKDSSLGAVFHLSVLHKVRIETTVARRSRIQKLFELIKVSELNVQSSTYLVQSLVFDRAGASEKAR